MPLINREVSLILTWFKNCAITSKATIDAEPAINNPTKGKFRITETKLYVLVVTLLTEDGHKLLEQLKTGFKRTIKWNKCRSEVTKKAKTVNLNYLIQHLTESIDYLFLHQYLNYKTFNVLIDGIGKLEEANRAAMLFIIEKSEETTFSFL